MFFFFKQKTAYEMRISDWSSDVCSSDLECPAGIALLVSERFDNRRVRRVLGEIGRQRYQQALDRCAGNGVDIGVAHAFRPHEGSFKALLGALSQQKSHLGMIAAV